MVEKEKRTRILKDLSKMPLENLFDQCMLEARVTESMIIFNESAPDPLAFYGDSINRINNLKIYLKSFQNRFEKVFSWKAYLTEEEKEKYSPARIDKKIRISTEGVDRIKDAIRFYYNRLNQLEAAA